MTRVGFTVAFVALALASGERRGAGGVQGQTVHDTLTFTKDVAPILYRHCASCHHPGGWAPFSLLTYEDVAGRARLIAAVTERRTMPPWQPEPGYAQFVGERRLSDAEIAVVRRWVESGSVEGLATDLPAAPEWEAGWLLGEPDLIVELPAYTVPARGRDRYRNLVVPIPLSEARYVSSVELRPGHPRVVHHARMMVDTTSSSRLFDEQDPAPGFDGMDIVSDADNPPGHFVGWTPGRVPFRGTDEIAWPLRPGTDLVIQLHLRPTGQPELVRAEVGFHFAERPPSNATALVMLGSYDLDIPPGASDYLVTDTYELPVDVEALGVYPHAHFLGREIWGFATLPNGTREWLIRIDNWDFNWQDEYRYTKPIPLPKGTTLTMRWVYDNSADNPRNPNHPPQRVVYGSLSSDEMSDLVIQVLPRTRSDLEILRRDLEWKYEISEVTYVARQEHATGRELAEQGRYTEAIEHFRAALRLKADDAEVYIGLAKALTSLGEFDAASAIAERAAGLTDYGDPVVLDGLAAVYSASGRANQALRVARQAVALARAAGRDSLANAIHRRLELYGQRNRNRH
jgi:mono/diheme cytochrome c family protein